MVTVVEVDVLAQWNLRDAVVDVVDSGATNQTWRVDDGDRVWFLRRSRNGDRRVVHTEHDLIAQVADAAVATPRPVPADNNDTVVDFDGAVFSLFESAEGRQLEPPDLGVEHAASAGAFLARLHTATAGVPIEAFRHVTLRWDGAAWANRVRTTAQLIRRDSSGDVDRWAFQRSMEQAAWLDDPNCRHSYAPTADVQVVHGDYQHANLFFEGTDVVAVIDWDSAVATTRGFEVVRACSFMFGLDTARTNSFLSGYRTRSRLSAAELNDGARAWGCYSDHHVWPLEETYRNGNRAAARFIPQQPFVPFARAWESLELDAV